jgi:uncharacterized protein
MSSVTLYETTVPLLQNGLKTVSHLVTKMEEYAAEKNIPVQELIDARLCGDMLPFSFQVHVSTDTAAKIIKRAMCEEPVSLSFDDTKTIEGIKARIAKVEEIVASADATKFNANANEIVPLGLGGDKTVKLPAKSYIVGYGIPNFFFHVQTGYSILRMKGVPLGKTDYLGSFMGPYVQQ